MCKLLKKLGFDPTTVTTDKLSSYSAAFSDLDLTARHEIGQHTNKRELKTPINPCDDERESFWVSSCQGQSSDALQFTLSSTISPTCCFQTPNVAMSHQSGKKRQQRARIILELEQN